MRAQARQLERVEMGMQLPCRLTQQHAGLILEQHPARGGWAQPDRAEVSPLTVRASVRRRPGPEARS